MLVVEKKSLTSIVLVYTILIFVIATIVPIIVYAQQPQSLINQNKSSPENKVTIDKDIDMNKIDKYAIINFNDCFKGQYQYAKPVLDKYNFKATFFIVCEYIDENKKNRMTWDEIQTLANQGHDIESHSMSHKVLDKMSESDLNYEIGQSKQCLLDKGINSSIFAYPRASGSDISTVIDKVASIYDLARTGFPPVTFLKCDGWVQNSSQKDCRTDYDNGTLTFANKYSLRGWMHERVLDDNFTFESNYRGNDNFNNYNTSASYYGNYSQDNSRTLDNFIDVVNFQNFYNDIHNHNNTNAISIITYHNIVNGIAPFEKGKLPITTDLDLFRGNEIFI